MQKKLNTPILLIGFNRPDLFLQVLSQVILVRPKRIYVAIDGPRNGRKDDVDNIEQIKCMVMKIKGIEVKTKYQKINLGCKYGPVAAINWFFDNEEMGIILEDDVKASESFFYFCQELLEKYKNDERVGSISGNNFIHDINLGGNSYLFSKYSQTWGWATWRRVWKNYDVTISSWPDLKKTNWLKTVFENELTVLYWKLVFDAIINNEISTAWDYQFTLLNWKQSYLTVIPKFNLTKNIGMGHINATHTKSINKSMDIKMFEIEFPLVHPNDIVSNVEFDEKIQKQNYVLWKEIGMKFIRKWNQARLRAW